MTTPPDGSAHGTDTSQMPVCPRHPGTVSYVRCQRCGRPTCPQCQRPASVGVHCVDCVAADRKAIPAQRSELGMTAAPGRPYVTYAIIAICAAVWLGELASPTFFNHIAFIPLVAEHEPWRFITSGFAHDNSSPMHLLFNMYALYVMGQYLEPMLGRVRFAAQYLLSVLGGSVAFELLTSPPTRGGDLYASGWATPLVGASGGVFGLFLAVVVFNKRLGREIGPMVGLIVVNAVIGFMAANVAWQAHVGGAVAGAVGSGVLYALRRKSLAVQIGALVALAVLLAVAAYVRFSMADTGWIQIVG